MNALVEQVQKSPLVQAAITEEVHRFYYDRILSDKEKDKIELIETQASDVLSTLWNLQPNWRYILEKAARKYNAEKNNSVSVFGKPKNVVALKFEFTVEKSGKSRSFIKKLWDKIF